MAEPLNAAFASDVDYKTFGRYVSADKIDDAVRAGAASAYAAYRALTPFRNRISVAQEARFPPQAQRYHLYLAKGCPFCHRVLIALHLLALETIVSFSFVDDERDGRGWAFRARYGADPINGFCFLREAYHRTDPSFNGHVSVPVLWDRNEQTIVNNNSGDIVVDLATQFSAFSNTPYRLYPEPLRAEIDQFEADLEADLSFGVYLAFLAKIEDERARCAQRVSDKLAFLDQRLSERRFLFGDSLTTSDIRLWPTLARFDAAYRPIFKIDVRPLVEHPNLWAYARDLYRLPAFAEFTDFNQFASDYARNFAAKAPPAFIADWRAEPGRSAANRVNNP